MVQSDTHAIDQQYRDIRTLLNATITNSTEELEGFFARAYAFPKGLGLDDFILRVTKKGYANALRSTTSLTPVSQLLKGCHLGQALLQPTEEHNAPSVSILLRQTGTRYADLGHDLEHAPNPGFQPVDFHSPVKQMQAVVRAAKESGENPFVPLLRTALQQLASGYRPDLNSTNVFLDEKTHAFRLIDQLNDDSSHIKRRNDATTVTARRVDMLCENIIQKVLRIDETRMDSISRCALATLKRLMSPEDRAAFPGLCDKVLTMVEEAKWHTIDRYVTKREPIPPLSFLHYEPTTRSYSGFGKTVSTEAIALDAPPHVLVERLRQMQSLVNAPQHR